MDTTNAPQMIEHLYNSLNFTPFDVKWIPGTAKFCLMGQTPKAEGILQIFQLNKKELENTDQITRSKGIKTSSFGASPINQAHLAIGDFDGYLEIYDLETKKPFYSVKAHDQMINSIDAIGGLGIGYGAPEIVTGGRDGLLVFRCVRVWDQRQKSPVLSLEPVEKEPAIPDCWAVGFGNSYNNDERVLAAGYDNGDVKLFDMRQNSLIWDTNLKNGVCSLEFDRRDIMMNKLVATTLEGKFHVFDVRTFNAEVGYASLCEPNLKSTVWGVKHLPQNREVFLVQGGNGTCYLYKYNYPPQRIIKDSMGKDRGVIGNIELLNSKELAQQPVSGFDWNRDKEGLAVLCGLDQSCRVVVFTKLNFF